MELDIINLLKKYKHKQIKEIIISIETDFKKWRNNSNYKKTVSFNKNLGGGVINELSHEIDYLNLLFGIPKKVMVENRNNRYKNIETHIDAIFEYDEKYPTAKMKLNMTSSKISSGT